jgi:hypothetical protein
MKLSKKLVENVRTGLIDFINDNYGIVFDNDVNDNQAKVFIEMIKNNLTYNQACDKVMTKNQKRHKGIIYK